MLYSKKKRFAFVHNPRCAGFSVKKSVLAVDPDATCNLWADRHVFAVHMRRQMEPKIWDSSFRWATVREPWQVIESDFRLTLKGIDEMGKDAATNLARGWYSRLLRVREHRDFEQFIAQEYLGKPQPFNKGGFWKTYCMGPEGADLGVRPIQFSRLSASWAGLCEAMGIPQCELVHENGAVVDGYESPSAWPYKVELRKLFADDLDRFQWDGCPW